MVKYRKNDFPVVAMVITVKSHECRGIPNQWHLHCLSNHLFRCTSKKTSKLCITGLCEGNPLVTGGFLLQRASNMCAQCIVMECPCQLNAIWWYRLATGPTWVWVHAYICMNIYRDAMHSTDGLWYLLCSNTGLIFICMAKEGLSQQEKILHIPCLLSLA